MKHLLLSLTILASVNLHADRWDSAKSYWPGNWQNLDAMSSYNKPENVKLYSGDNLTKAELIYSFAFDKNMSYAELLSLKRSVEETDMVTTANSLYLGSASYSYKIKAGIATNQDSKIYQDLLKSYKFTKRDKPTVELRSSYNRFCDYSQISNSVVEEIFCADSVELVDFKFRNIRNKNGTLINQYIANMDNTLETRVLIEMRKHLMENYANVDSVGDMTSILSNDMLMLRQVRVGNLDSVHNMITAGFSNWKATDAFGNGVLHLFSIDAGSYFSYDTRKIADDRVRIFVEHAIAGGADVNLVNTKGERPTDSFFNSFKKSFGKEAYVVPFAYIIKLGAKIDNNFWNGLLSSTKYIMEAYSNNRGINKKHLVDSYGGYLHMIADQIRENGLTERDVQSEFGKALIKENQSFRSSWSLSYPKFENDTELEINERKYKSFNTNSRSILGDFVFQD